MAAIGDRLWGTAAHGAWRLDPLGMSALIAGADADQDQLAESFHRLGDELNGAVALVGGAVAQALAYAGPCTTSTSVTCPCA